MHHVRARERAFVVRFLFPRVYSFFSPLSPPKSLVDQSWPSRSRGGLFARICSFYALLDSLSFPLSLSLFISPSVSLPSLSFIFLLVCSSYMGGVKLRNELSRNDAFFSQGTTKKRKKERDPSKFDYLYFFSNQRERKRALPNNKKSSQNTTTASEDVIYIHILTHTRVTQNTSQYSTTHDERRRQDEIFKVLRTVERRTRAR